jgi:hypothetical protein
MNKYKLSQLTGSLLMLLSIVGTCLAQETPSILSISQKQISDERGDSVQISCILSQNTESISVTEATFFTATSTGQITSPIAVGSPTAQPNGTRIIEISLSYGENKQIQPNYTSVSVKLIPTSTGKTGGPYTVAFSATELGKVFNALRDQRSKERLEEDIARQSRDIESLKSILSKFRPKLEWDVVEGFNALRFDATSTKDAQITIKATCEGNVSTDIISLKANVVGQLRKEFSNPVRCSFEVSENNPPAEESQRLVISAKGKTMFSTPNLENKPTLAFNPAKQLKALSPTKVTLPLSLSNADRIEIDLDRQRSGQPSERITKDAPVKKDLKNCRNISANAGDGCLEDVTVDLPRMDPSTDYQLLIRAYNNDPLSKPVEITGKVTSLPERFTQSILLTFTKKGVKFTALTGAVEAEIDVAPEWVDKKDAPLPFKKVTSVKGKDPSIELSTADWLASLVNTKQVGDSSSATTPPKQLRFGINIQAKDDTGRSEPYSLTLAVDSSDAPNKKESEIKKFFSKAVAVANDNRTGDNPSLKFNTVGGAIASIIGLLVGL